MHDPFGLASRTRGVHDLGDLVGVRAPRGEQGRDVEAGLVRWIEQALLEGRRGVVAADHQHVFERRQAGSQAGQHGGVVAATERARHDHYAGRGMAEHEFELTLPEDRHEGIDDHADAHACGVQRGVFPPARQLHADDVTRRESEPREAGGDADGMGAQRAIGQHASRAEQTVVIDDGNSRRGLPCDSVEAIDQ